MLKNSLGRKQARKGHPPGFWVPLLPLGWQEWLPVRTSTTEGNRAETVAAPPRRCLYSWSELVRLCLNTSSSGLSTLSIHGYFPLAPGVTLVHLPRPQEP